MTVNPMSAAMSVEPCGLTDWSSIFRERMLIVGLIAELRCWDLYKGWEDLSACRSGEYIISS
jgi:hypothetical protein